MYQIFKNREEAGFLLAKELKELARRRDAIVVALPRGGVPVAFEVARMLDLPLDILVVRKLGVPGHDELAFGAVASGGKRFINESIVRSLRIPGHVVETVVEREMGELDRRERVYRGVKPKLDVKGKIVIVVDDGLATGASMRVACEALRSCHPKQIVVAVPVAAAETVRELKNELHVKCVSVLQPYPFYAVGLWYDDFDQTTDDEVRELLSVAETRTISAAHSA